MFVQHEKPRITSINFFYEYRWHGCYTGHPVRHRYPTFSCASSQFWSIGMPKLYTGNSEIYQWFVCNHFPALDNGQAVYLWYIWL